MEQMFIQLTQLPKEILDIVYEYISTLSLLTVSKNYYLKYHHIVKQHINSKKLESYIRSMVRQDNDFVFSQLLTENYHNWLKITKYYYKECIYQNYLIFLESYMIDNKSPKCREELIKLYQQQGFKKNQHKKSAIRYIRWKT